MFKPSPYSWIHRWWCGLPMDGWKVTMMMMMMRLMMMMKGVVVVEGDRVRFQPSWKITLFTSKSLLPRHLYCEFEPILILSLVAFLSGGHIDGVVSNLGICFEPKVVIIIVNKVIIYVIIITTFTTVTMITLHRGVNVASDMKLSQFKLNIQPHLQIQFVTLN